MTVYDDALWTEASHDHEAAHDAEVMGAAQVAGAEVFSVLASAEHETDFYNRLALLHDNIHAVAASIAAEGTPDYTRIVTALPERYFEDWHLLAEARRKEAQARNAPRAAARAAEREAAAKSESERPAGCSCAYNNDGSVTTLMCPLHAKEDPCYTMALVTGRRRKGSIINGTCTNCGWSESSAKTAASQDVFDADMERLNKALAPYARTLDDGSMVLDGAPPDLADAYRRLMQYGYANGLMDAYASKTGSIKMAYSKDDYFTLARAYLALTGTHLEADHQSTTIAFALNRMSVEKALTALASDKGHSFSTMDALMALDAATQRTSSLSDLFATATIEHSTWVTPDGAAEAVPMEEAIRRATTDEDDPVTWDEGKKKAALWPWERTATDDDGHSDADCAVCHHPLWWNPERKEYVHRSEYGDQGHKPVPMEVQEYDEHYHDDPQPYPYYNAACPNCGGDHEGQCPYPWLAQHDASKRTAGVWNPGDPVPYRFQPGDGVVFVNWNGAEAEGNVVADPAEGMPNDAFVEFRAKDGSQFPVNRNQLRINNPGAFRGAQAAKQAAGDNSWPPKEGGEKEGGDPKAPPAAPGAPQVPQPTATEQAQPGQPGTPASGITVGTVLLDAVDGMVATYEVNNVTDEGETMLVSVTKNGGEQMDLRIPKTEPVQTYQAKGDDATAPVEQPEGAPASNPFAEKADGEKAPEEGAEKPEGEEKPKDDEGDEGKKKKGNPFA